MFASTPKGIVIDIIAIERSDEFRNFIRLAVFSGCLSVCDIFLYRDQMCKLWITTPPSFFVLIGIFLCFLERGIFSLQLLIFFSRNFDQVYHSITISGMEHIFGFLERKFYCTSFMFWKFFDMMSRSWGS